MAFPRVPSSPGTLIIQTIFSLCCPLNDRRRAALIFSKIGRLLFLLFCFSFSRAFILLLMSGNVHPNAGPVFPSSVCAGQVTWRGRSVQCCTCSKLFHLRCSLPFFSRFNALASCHSWSCSCCVPAFCKVSIPYNTVSSSSLGSSSLYTSTVQPGPPGPRQLMQRSCRIVFKPSTLFPPTLYLLTLHSSHFFIFLAVFLYLLLSRSGLFNEMPKVFAELLHFISSHPVDLICIQVSNLNSFSSFRIPGFSSLGSDLTYSRSGILSPDDPHASGGLIIFVRQGISFSELSTSSFFSLDSLH